MRVNGMRSLFSFSAVCCKAKYDDEAVTLRQMKEITDKKIDTDNFLPQTLKSRLLIPDYDSDKDVVVKKYVESKTFPLDVSKGLGMKVIR